MFARLARVIKSLFNRGLDKIEDPIRMTEQGVRELKEELHKTLQAQVQVLTQAKLTKQKHDELQGSQQKFDDKAMYLLKEGNEDGARTALVEKKVQGDQLKVFKAEYEKQEILSDNIKKEVNKLRVAISKYENELIMLKARAQTAASVKQIRQQLSTINSTSVISMIENMKAKVVEDEAMAEAYGELMGDDGTKTYEQIEPEVEDTLKRLKEQLKKDA